MKRMKQMKAIKNKAKKNTCRSDCHRRNTWRTAYSKRNGETRTNVCRKNHAITEKKRRQESDAFAFEKRKQKRNPEYRRQQHSRKDNQTTSENISKEK